MNSYGLVTSAAPNPVNLNGPAAFILQPPVALVHVVFVSPSRDVERVFFVEFVVSLRSQLHEGTSLEPFVLPMPLVGQRRCQ